ncbi:MAG: HD domain-containing phosphohydrolase [Candidatus Izemoplasmatales bacterium]|nr:diguanylate cyclase [Candidatus Izemoplasmatales bacterium]MDY0372569.1 diguanylate cyclase [Candidatus Izemoplasmatales bacterium]
MPPLADWWESFSEIAAALVQNIVLLFAMIFLYSSSNMTPEGTKPFRKVIQGLIIGGFSILIMTFPWETGTGVIFDTRSVLLGITGVFFGPIATIIAALIALYYRLFVIGGAGVISGVLTIGTSSILGLLFHKGRRLFSRWPRFFQYYLFGVVLHIVTVLCFLALPAIDRQDMILQVFPMFLGIFPVVTALLAITIHNQIDRLSSAAFQRRQQVLLQSSIDSPKEMEIYAVDTDFNYLTYNDFHAKCIRKYYDKTIAPGMHFFDNITDDQMAHRIRNSFEKALKGEVISKIEEVETVPGKFLENNYSPITNESGKIIGVTVFTNDVTERKNYEQSILYLSYHDALTGLKNRRFYIEELARVDHPDALPLSIIMADINGLKLMNDAFGHDAGDELLCIVASELNNCFLGKANVSRVGGDEFVIILENTSKGEATNYIERAKTRIENHTLNSMNVSVSFGVETKVDNLSIQEVIKIAEDDMYKHKLFETSSSRSEAINAILSTLFMKNPREELHSERVGDICQHIGQILGMRKDEINLLKVISNLHDIGKIAIDEQILNKPGKLNEEEWAEIKRHPEIGYRILSSSSEYAEISEDILSHHERWDGDGYPQGLKGKDIPYRARIIAIADAYDAMTSDRPYRKALSKEEALAEIIRCSGTQFDPSIARKFVDNFQSDK